MGIARAVGDAHADPGDPAGKRHTVDVVPVRRLRRPVTLAEIKADRAFASFALTRNPRLSVMPVSPKEWSLIEGKAKS